MGMGIIVTRIARGPKVHICVGRSGILETPYGLCVGCKGKTSEGRAACDACMARFLARGQVKRLPSVKEMAEAGRAE